MSTKVGLTGAWRTFYGTPFTHWMRVWGPLKSLGGRALESYPFGFAQGRLLRTERAKDGARGTRHFLETFRLIYSAARPMCLL
jgi:hypothetical protein